MADTAHPIKGQTEAPLRQAEFWDPEIEVTKRPDGSLIVRQLGELGPWPERISDRLLHWAHETPDRLYLADRGADGAWRKLTYAQALDRARHLGQALLDRGVSAQHPLLILSGNDLEHAQLALACYLVGVPYAPLSEAYSLVSSDFGKLKTIVAELEPGLIYARDGKVFEKPIATVIPHSVPVAVGQNPARSDTVLFADLLATPVTGEVERARRAVGPDTIAKFLFTSGSTGSPKAVINTNRMLCANQAMVADCYAFMRDEPPVILDWSPWNHTAGGNKVFNLVLYNGGTLYIDDGRPTPEGMKKTIRNLKEVAPTWYFNVPKGYEDLVHAFEADADLCRNFFSRVKMLMYAGAAIAQHTQDDLARLAVETTGERILIAAGLGATETAPFALMCTFEPERAGNVGLPSKGLEMKLVPVDDKLEVHLKGPTITPGYWKHPELTAKVFDQEGFYNLGDALRFADPEDVMKGFYFDGRTAENFKLATGTWVNVGRVRAGFINHFGGLVRDVALTGLNQDFIGALVFPSLKDCAALAGDPEMTLSDVVADPGVRQVFEEKLKSLAGTATGSSMRVARMILLDTPPDIDRGEVTDKGSINQRAVLSHRQAEVAEIYDGSDRVVSI